MASRLDGTQAPVVVVLARLDGLHRSRCLDEWLVKTCRFNELQSKVVVSREGTKPLAFRLGETGSLLQTYWKTQSPTEYFAHLANSR